MGGLGAALRAEAGRGALLFRPRAAPRGRPDAARARVWAFFADASLYDALAALADGLGIKPVLDPAARRVAVSLDARDVPLSQAVAELLAASERAGAAYSASFDKGALTVKRKPAP